MIDTHSHINFQDYKENFEKFLSEIKQNEVEKIIIPGVEPLSFNEIISLCNKYEMIYGALGVHPSEFKTYNQEVEETIYKLIKESKIVAIGEIGLDYHYGFDSKEEQKNIHIGDNSNLNNKMLFVSAIIETEKGKAGDVYVNGDLNNKFEPYFREKL